MLTHLKLETAIDASASRKTVDLPVSHEISFVVNGKTVMTSGD